MSCRPKHENRKKKLYINHRHCAMAILLHFVTETAFCQWRTELMCSQVDTLHHVECAFQVVGALSHVLIFTPIHTLMCS